MDLTMLPGYVPGFPDTLNLRDIGGLTTEDGRTVRLGLLYRSSALLELDSKHQSRIDALGLRFVLDLRAAGEAAEVLEYIPDGAEYLRCGGMVDERGVEVDFSPKGISEIQDRFTLDPEGFMRSLYVNMTKGNRAMHVLVERLVAGQVPLLFHCTAGKDRTGVAAATIHALLGVPDEAIVEGFLLTNKYRSSIINMPPNELPEWVSESDRENWADINGVKESNIRAALANMGTTAAERRAYFASEYGLDDVAIAALRDRYTE